MCLPVISAHARRRADRIAGVEVRELHPAFGEFVDVRRLDLLLPVAAEFEAAEIVGDDEHDVRRPFGGCGR